MAFLLRQVFAFLSLLAALSALGVTLSPSLPWVQTEIRKNGSLDHVHLTVNLWQYCIDGLLCTELKYSLNAEEFKSAREMTTNSVFASLAFIILALTSLLFGKVAAFIACAGAGCCSTLLCIFCFYYLKSMDYDRLGFGTFGIDMGLGLVFSSLLFSGAGVYFARQAKES